MNYGELKEAALGDTHHENFSAHIARFTAEAEAFIYARLSSYGLEVDLTDADRSDVESPVYTLPAKLIDVRYLFKDGYPLRKADETTVYQNRKSPNGIYYCVRPKAIVVAGTPAEDSVLALHYWGIPPALANDEDTNTLLNDYPQLYKRAIAISIYERARDFEGKQDAQNNVVSLIDEINVKVKKQLGGAQSSNPYNVRFRSSY